MARCKDDCIHYEICAREGRMVQIDEHTWDEYNCLDDVEHFCDKYMPTADVAPKSEVAKEVLLELKKQVHDKAVYINSQDIPNYINLKVFDAILQNYINNLK